MQTIQEGETGRSNLNMNTTYSFRRINLGTILNVSKKTRKISYIPKYLHNLITKRNFKKPPQYKAPQTPRVAFCLFGLIGGVKGYSRDNIIGSEDVLNIGYEHCKKHIFNKNLNVDVFIHTWSIDLEKEITQLYKPTKSIFQKQITFDIPNYIPRKEGREFSQYSMSYSIKKVIELKARYEKENNFKYDLVMLTRFDLAFEEDFIFNKFDPAYFYAANWYSRINLFGFIPIYIPMGYPYLGYGGLVDLWFISSSENMDKFSRLFDYLDEYNRPENCDRTEGGISNHSLVRYHLQKVGLSNKIRFVFNHLGWKTSRPHFLFRWYSPKESTPLVRRKYFNSKE